MQRPRRTTEFQEEVPGTSTRKARKNTSPAPPSTLQKMPTRQSRIAVPIRSSSSDRSSAAALLGLPQPSSTIRNRPTPQKTPLRKTAAPRELFTAEKQRCVVAGPGLHNDKKWVHDQMQRITNHLCGVSATGVIPAFSSEFFTRPNALKQISIKQFVGIINYFLHFIWGNRFTVGPNHVEDIVNILQKLNYPYQVNKSWLKTPNAQHSFGNVIVLLDFLMDFVPPQGEEQAKQMQFPLQEPHEQTITQSSMIEFQIPDTEFQLLLLVHSEEGFKLWDKQLLQEYSALQQHSCDVLVQKRCGVADTAALIAETEKLKKTLEELEKQTPPIDKAAEDKYIQKEEDLKYTKQQIEMTMDDLKSGEQILAELKVQMQSYADEAQTIEQKITHLENAIKNQIFTKVQRDELIEKIAQLKQLVQSQERAKQDMETRNLHQQVLYSRAQKQLTDQVEVFNAYMREICYTQMLTDTIDLQLPFKPEEEHLRHSVAVLTELRKDIKARIERMSEEKGMLDQKNSKIGQEILATLEPSIRKLTTSITIAQKRTHSIELKSKKERNRFNEKVQHLDERLNQLQMEIEEYEKVIAQKQQELERLKSENEETMTKAEEEYHKCADKRENYLDEYAEALEVVTAELKETNDDLERDEMEIENYKKELENQKK